MLGFVSLNEGMVCFFMKFELLITVRFSVFLVSFAMLMHTVSVVGVLFSSEYMVIHLISVFRVSICFQHFSFSEATSHFYWVA